MEILPQEASEKQSNSSVHFATTIIDGEPTFPGAIAADFMFAAPAHVESGTACMPVNPSPFEPRVESSPAVMRHAKTAPFEMMDPPLRLSRDRCDIRLREPAGTRQRGVTCHTCGAQANGTEPVQCKG